MPVKKPPDLLEPANKRRAVLDSLPFYYSVQRRVSVGIFKPQFSVLVFPDLPTLIFFGSEHKI